MITLGGVQLTSDASTLAFAEARLSLADLKSWARRSWPGRLATLGLDWLGREERPVYNRLVWPNSASQFAYGHFICTTADLAILRGAAYEGGAGLGSLALTLNDGNPGRNFTSNMYLLPARPLGQCGTAGDQYLLTLVDQRYYWWEAAGSVAVTAGVTTWAQLFAAIGTALGVSITVDPVPAAYLNPPVDFNTYFEYLPPQLDAAARSVGMKVVVRTDGTVHVVSAATAATTFAGNLAFNPIAAGGLIDLTNDATSDLASVLPASVEVAFPTVDASNVPDGTSTGVPVTLLSLLLPQYSGVTTFVGQHLLRCTAGAGPSNTAQITALATQMASDWYQWQAARPDVAYNGVCPWVMSGMEDRVEWTHHASAITTRVQRPPWNVKNEAGLVSGSGGSVTNYFLNLTVTNLTVNNLTVYEILLQYTIVTLTFTTITNYDVTDVSKLALIPKAGGTTITNLTGGLPGQVLYVLNVGSDKLVLAGGGNILPPLPYSYTLYPQDGVMIELIQDPGSMPATYHWRFDNPTFGFIDSDTSNLAYACRQIIASNDLSANTNDRIVGIAGAGGIVTLHWQGQRGTTDGTTFVGPQKDTWLSPGTRIGIVPSSDAGSHTIKYVISSTGTGVTVENVDATNVTNNCALIEANNDLGTAKYARIHWDGTALDWQGIKGYLAGTGLIGPAADLEFVAGTNVTLALSLDAAGGSPTGTDALKLTINSTGGGSVFSGARVNNSGGGSQTILASTPTTLTFQAALYDTSSYFGAAGTSTLTAPAAGKYHIGGNIEFDIGASMATVQGQVTLRILKGTTIIASQTAYFINTIGTLWRVNVSCDYSLASSDTVHLVVEQDSLAGGLVTSAVPELSDFSPQFWIHQIH